GGYYQGPPVMAPPQYAAAPPPRNNQVWQLCVAAVCLTSVAVTQPSFSTNTYTGSSVPFLVTISYHI
ncbi:hypothetical protein Tco_1014638, partial [Tanacetum coccineum]